MEFFSTLHKVFTERGHKPGDFTIEEVDDKKGFHQISYESKCKECQCALQYSFLPLSKVRKFEILFSFLIQERFIGTIFYSVNPLLVSNKIFDPEIKYCPRIAVML